MSTYRHRSAALAVTIEHRIALLDLDRMIFDRTATLGGHEDFAGDHLSEQCKHHREVA